VLCSAEHRRGFAGKSDGGRDGPDRGGLLCDVGKREGVGLRHAMEMFEVSLDLGDRVPPDPVLDLWKFIRHLKYKH